MCFLFVMWQAISMCPDCWHSSQFVAKVTVYDLCLCLAQSEGFVAIQTFAVVTSTLLHISGKASIVALWFKLLVLGECATCTFIFSFSTKHTSVDLFYLSVVECRRHCLFAHFCSPILLPTFRLMCVYRALGNILQLLLISLLHSLPNFSSLSIFIAHVFPTH